MGFASCMFAILRRLLTVRTMLEKLDKKKERRLQTENEKAPSRLVQWGLNPIVSIVALLTYFGFAWI
ncbi:MAG: hypothetical protein JWR07_5545 [Nevskia sp.]|nr:hypothetical protein [Nevskia sp.]